MRTLNKTWGRKNLNKIMVICIVPADDSETKEKKGDKEDLYGTVPLSKGSAQNLLDGC